MDNIAIYLAIAETGLGTASSLLQAQAAGNNAKASKEKNKVKKEAYLNEAKKQEQLAKALKAALAGITSYRA